MIKDKLRKILSCGLAITMLASTFAPNMISAVTPEVIEKTETYNVNTYHFYKFNEEDSKFFDGPYGDTKGYTPYWRYSKEYSESDRDGKMSLLEPDCFRANGDVVTYCLDLGKAGPDGIDMKYTSKELDDKLNRVIKMGYPNKTGADYETSDVELEWATAVALKIVEGHEWRLSSDKGFYQKESDLTLEAFTNGVLDETFSRKYYNDKQLTDEQIAVYHEKALNAKALVETLVAFANDSSIKLDGIYPIDVKDVKLGANESEYMVGPFMASLVSNENSKAEIKVTGASDDYKIVNANGEPITIDNFSEDFYIKGTTDKELDIKVEFFAVDLKTPTRVCYSTDKTNSKGIPYQRMYVTETITLSAESNAKVSLTPTFGTTLTKTDLITGEAVPGATIEITDKNGTPINGSPFVTDDEGKIAINNIPAGTYTFKETIAPDGYILNKEESSFTIDESGKVTGKTSLTNKPNEVVLTKTDFVTGEIVPGATIEVTKKDGTPINGSPFVTDKEGKITISKLPVGEYIFRETIAPDGYILNEEECMFSIDETGKVTGKTTLTNKPNEVVLTKTDLVTGEAVPDAVIEITKDGTPISGSPFTTDKEGKITLPKLPAGTYTFKETVAPDGYILNEEESSFTVTENGEITGKTSLTNKPTEVVITKTDLVSGEPVPGAVIEITKDGKPVDGSPFTTDEEGKITLHKLPVGEYTFKETVAPAGYILNKTECKFSIDKDGNVTGTTTLTNEQNKAILTKTDLVTGKAVPGAVIEITDKNGKPITGSPFTTDENGQIEISKLPVGKYTFKETIAPEGYILSKETCEFEVKEDGTIEGTTVLKNAPTEITLTKIDATSKVALEGAVFVIKDKSGKEVAEVTTDKDGKAIVRNLPVGEYTFVEKKAPKGYVLSTKENSFTIKEDGTISGTLVLENTSNEVILTKTDAVTGKGVAGATIEVFDSANNQVFKGVTDKNGQIIIGKLAVGEYTFKETIAPDGYILSKEECKFVVNENGKVEGTTVLKNTPTSVTITKKDKDDGKVLSGAKYEFRKGNTIITTEETNKDGKIVLNKLPIGEYTFKEVSAPSGYALDTKTYSFTIKEDGTISGTTEVADSKISITLYKKDLTTGETLEGAKFVVKDKDGKVVAESTTDSSGKIVINKIAAGQYKLQETVAPKGYELNKTVYTFTINPDGTVEGETTIYNKKLKVTTETSQTTTTTQTTTTNTTGTNKTTSGNGGGNEIVKTGDYMNSNGTRFMIIGLAIVIAGFGFASLRKKEEE